MGDDFQNGPTSSAASHRLANNLLVSGSTPASRRHLRNSLAATQGVRGGGTVQIQSAESAAHLRPRIESYIAPPEWS